MVACPPKGPLMEWLPDGRDISHPQLTIGPAGTEHHRLPVRTSPVLRGRAQVSKGAESLTKTSINTSVPRSLVRLLSSQEPSLGRFVLGLNRQRAHAPYRGAFRPSLAPRPARCRHSLTSTTPRNATIQRFATQRSLPNRAGRSRTSRIGSGSRQYRQAGSANRRPPPGPSSRVGAGFGGR